DLEYCSDAYETADGADVVAILTEWNEFKALDLARLKDRMRGNSFADGRNLFSLERLREQGFTAVGIGREPSHEALMV
nr:UDP-glucose 6-dehydrogenase [Cyanobacteria bacterium UBA8530]